jgi:hypothetical protein
MISAEQFQTSRCSRKITEALKLISTARSCLALLEPASKVTLGVDKDEDALSAVAHQLHELRVRLGYRPNQTSPTRAADLLHPSTGILVPLPLPPRAPPDSTFKPAVVIGRVALPRAKP